MTSADDRREFPALGTTAVVSCADARRVQDAVEVVRNVVERMDLACSRFRPDSELNRLNESGGRPVRVGSLLLDSVRAALDAAAVTDGDLDPTIGTAVRLIGYDRSFDLIGRGVDLPTDGGGAAAPGFGPLTVETGWRSVEVDVERSTIRLPAGARLDLGATAKAYAADIAALSAVARVGCGVLVGLGGDIATAGDPPDEGWYVGIADHHAATDDDLDQTVVLHGGALATSSTTVRRWRRGGDDMHHIVDPATGRPAQVVWRTASVAASTCLGANVASTTAIIRGERATAWLSGLGLAARLVRGDGRVAYIGAWPRQVEETAGR